MTAYKNIPSGLENDENSHADRIDRSKAAQSRKTASLKVEREMKFAYIQSHLTEQQKYQKYFLFSWVWKICKKMAYKFAYVIFL